MKTRFIHKVLATLGLAVFPFINGCTQQSAGNAPSYVTTSSVAPPVVHVAPATPVTAVQTAPIVAEIAQQPAAGPVESAEPAPAAAVVLPEKLRISQSLNEVIRLAQSGVDEGVILTYVTNSSAMFVLGAEEIVYLNDLGIDSGVITAMMQRDQALKVAATNAQQIAAAPTYVNPPQPAVVQESQPVQVTENYFYDTLSPYGTWVEVEGYGRCWRPTVSVTSPTWRPYVDRGRWVHTDAGWYWMSDYSWGSVAFHYGRWFSHPRMGWCWWPDNVWGPSWVSWRYDNDHCGWAPLPPLSYYRPGAGFYYRDRNVGFSFDFGIGVDAFTFVQWGRFCDSRPYQHCLPRNRVNTVYQQTTIVNNYGDGNNTVINRGISRDRVRDHTRTEVRTVSIRDERPRKGEVRSERLESGGRTLVVPRPILPPLPPLPGIGKIGSPFEKSNARVYSTTPPAPASATTVQPATVSPREAGRESKSGRERKVTAPVTINQPVVVAPSTTPQPDNNRSGRSEREQRVESKSSERNRSTQVVTPTPTVTAPPATPARTTTPIFSKPLVVENVPHAPSRPIITPSQNSTTVIGDGRNRSGNRDYSVWNTPKQQPAPTPQPLPSASAPEYNNRNTSRNQSPRESVPQVEEVQSPQPSRPSPSENRPSNNSRIEQKMERENRAIATERQSRSRSEERSFAPAISTPAPRPAAPIYTPPSAPVSRPSPPAYTPPAAAPRVESQPAPSRSESSRPETRSESRSESKSDSGRPRRDR